MRKTATITSSPLSSMDCSLPTPSRHAKDISPASSRWFNEAARCTDDLNSTIRNLARQYQRKDGPLLNQVGMDGSSLSGRSSEPYDIVLDQSCDDRVPSFQLAMDCNPRIAINDEDVDRFAKIRMRIPVTERTKSHQKKPVRFSYPQEGKERLHKAEIPRTLKAVKSTNCNLISTQLAEKEVGVTGKKHSSCMEEAFLKTQPTECTSSGHNGTSLLDKLAMSDSSKAMDYFPRSHQATNDFTPHHKSERSVESCGTGTAMDYFPRSHNATNHFTPHKSARSVESCGTGTLRPSPFQLDESRRPTTTDSVYPLQMGLANRSSPYNKGQCKALLRLSLHHQSSHSKATFAADFSGYDARTSQSSLDTTTSLQTWSSGVSFTGYGELGR